MVPMTEFGFAAGNFKTGTDFLEARAKFQKQHPTLMLRLAGFTDARLRKFVPMVLEVLESRDLMPDGAAPISLSGLELYPFPKASLGETRKGLANFSKPALERLRDALAIHTYWRSLSMK